VTLGGKKNPKEPLISYEKTEVDECKGKGGSGEGNVIRER
jgi:hypothetical protein